MALHISGMAAAIVDSKKVLFAETYGYCNSIDTPFNQRVSKYFGLPIAGGAGLSR